MKTRRYITAVPIVAMAIFVSTRHAPAQSPPGAATATPAVAVVANAGAPPLEADPPAGEKSAVPKAAEWAKASPVRLARVGPAASGCIALRVREWLRIRCPIRTFAISLLGGSNEGVAFWIGPEAEQQPGEVQFPLRRGDRRVVELWTYGKDAEGGFMPQPALVVQEHWVDGEAAPTVTAL
jgi:hypothetical protein